MTIKLGHRVFIRSIKRKGSVEYIDWPHLSFPYMYPIQVALDRPYKHPSGPPTMMYRTDASDLKQLNVKVTAHNPQEQHMADLLEDVIEHHPDLSRFFKYLNKF